MNQVICIKWGEKYSGDYVNRLQRMLERQTTAPFQLHCFTDSAEGIFPEVKVHPLPELGCEIPKTVPGKFPKIALWRKDLPVPAGPALFIDLDTVLVGNIDCYFEVGDPQDVYLAKNWAKPFMGLGQTSVFRFPVGGHSYILENLQANTVELAEKYRYEQHYVTRNVHPKVKFWPNKWTRHYRLHCLGIWWLRYIRKPRLPRGARIITFPGFPDPVDAIKGRMEADLPAGLSRVEQVKHAMGLKREQTQTKKEWRKQRWRQLRQYTPKADWLMKHWDVL